MVVSIRLWKANKSKKMGVTEMRILRWMSEHIRNDKLKGKSDTYWEENDRNQIMMIWTYVKKTTKDFNEKSWSNDF